MYDVTTREDTQLQRAPLQRYVVRYLNGTKTVQPCFCTQVTQLSRLSNEAAFWLHESRGQGSGVLVAFVEVNINLSVSKIFLYCICVWVMN